MQNNEARRRSSPPQRFLPSLGATRTRRRTRSFAGTCHTLQNRLPGSPLDASRGATRDDSACSSVFHSGEPIDRLGEAEGGSYSNEPSAFLNNQGGCESCVHDLWCWRKARCKARKALLTPSDAPLASLWSANRAREAQTPDRGSAVAENKKCGTKVETQCSVSRRSNACYRVVMACSGRPLECSQGMEVETPDRGSAVA